MDTAISLTSTGKTYECTWKFAENNCRISITHLTKVILMAYSKTSTVCSWFQRDTNVPVNHIVLLVVRNKSIQDLRQNRSVGMKRIFRTVLRLGYTKSNSALEDICSLPFFTEVKTNLPTASGLFDAIELASFFNGVVDATQIKSHDHLGEECRVKSFQSFHGRVVKNSDCFPRTMLLYNPQQLYFNCIPFLGADVYFSKSNYAPVTDNSPLFCIETRRLLTTKLKNGDIARLVIVDEDENVVIDQLVRPPNDILDYDTSFSNITEEKMKNTTVGIAEVRKMISDLLPGDAILAGSSIVHDLQDLHMAHPYVIDVAKIFQQPSTSVLTSTIKISPTILGRIRNGDLCDNKDSLVANCIASMRLIKLKLHNTYRFGDSEKSKVAGVSADCFRAGNYKVSSQALRFSFTPGAPVKSLLQARSKPKSDKLESTWEFNTGEQKYNRPIATLPMTPANFLRQFVFASLFTVLSYAGVANAVVDDNPDEGYPAYLSDYMNRTSVKSSAELATNVNSRIQKGTSFVVAHLTQGQSVQEVDKIVTDIYDSLPKNSLIMTVFEGKRNSGGSNEDGVAFFCGK